jgi:hypothetical protein
VFFVIKRDEVTGKWRRLHNEELNDLYPSPSTVRVIKSRRMRWAGHVKRMWERRDIEGFDRETLGERNNSEDPCVDGRIILRWIFRKWDLGL